MGIDLGDILKWKDSALVEGPALALLTLSGASGSHSAVIAIRASSATLWLSAGFSEGFHKMGPRGFKRVEGTQTRFIPK